MIHKLLCLLGLHKYYTKTYSLDKYGGETLFKNEFECKRCGKIIKSKPGLTSFEIMVLLIVFLIGAYIVYSTIMFPMG